MKSIKILILFASFLILGCNTGKEQEIAATPSIDEDTVFLSKAQFDGAKMEIGMVEEKDFAETVHATGVVDVPPANKAVISAFYGGYIKNASLMIGDKVKKGERLVTLENPEFITMQQNFMETAEQLNFLKSEYERQKTMLAENITSQKSFLKAESDYKTAVARTNSLKKSLQMLNINPNSVLNGDIVSQVTIFSPINGYITKVSVNSGTYVSPSDEIMEVVNTDDIQLELKIFEKNILHLKKGQEILFRVPEASSEVFTAKVNLVGTTIDPNGRNAVVHGNIDKKDTLNFSTGMFVEADIVTGTSKLAALPEDAVVEMEGTTYVLKIESEHSDGYTLLPIEVAPEFTYKGFTSFKNPLPAGKFLTKGGFSLLQGEGGGHSH